MNKTCKNCQKEFEITDDDLAFYDKVSPEIAGKKYSLPSPTLCFECRFQRRITHRNERILYQRKCDAPGHNHIIVSMYDESPDYKVYCQPYWWSDEWDASDFGSDYDPNKSFFAQFGELQRNVPRVSLTNTKAENSEFSNYTFGCKNCYMEIGGVESDFALFSYNSIKNRDCSDCLMTSDCENCYELLDSANCYSVSFGRFCENCRESTYLYDCKSCSNCIGCIGLRNKQYHIFNKPYTKEEYEKKAIEYSIGDWSKLQKLAKEAREFFVTFPHEYARLKNCENIIGNSVENSKNCQMVFDVLASSDAPVGAEDSKFSVMCGLGLKDCYDIYQHGGPSSLCLEIAGGMWSSVTHFCLRPLRCSNTFYSENCDGCKDCFGCTGLKNKQYCILNKQYSKEEYEKKVAEIIDKMAKDNEWGEFFDPKISLFAYNESMAMSYFPLSKEEVLAQNYRWKERPNRNYQPTKKYSDLPDSIKEAQDSLVGELVSCQSVDENKDELEKRNCSTAFKLVPQELLLYKKLGIALPRKCPNCRFFDRTARRDSIVLHHRQCTCEESGHDHSARCPNEFETTYAPERPEKVYCESCYQKSVI